MKSKLIIGLLTILIVLAIIDILTGIFYWNRTYLEFDASNFNNISTPIIGVISLIVYGLALNLSQRQNKLLQSQHLRFYYAREVDKIIQDFNKKLIDTKIIQREKNDYNYITVHRLISTLLADLRENSDYLLDLESFKKGDKLSLNYFKGRSYYPLVLFLSEYTLGLPYVGFQNTKDLLTEIENADLTTVDKLHLRMRIKKEILNEYLGMMEFMEKAEFMVPPIPVLFNISTSESMGVEFKTLNKTKYRNHYDYFKDKFE